jgi:aubergine-like protein
MKFFEKDSSSYRHGSPGLIIYDSIVNPNLHEFYIQPQFVNEGCATPTNYHIAYGDLNLANYIPHLTLGLCYNYANWQGPIRVPAPLKNAEKLSKLVAKYTKEELHPKLVNSQVYL